jgi:hypothetical protein
MLAGLIENPAAARRRPVRLTAVARPKVRPPGSQQSARSGHKSRNGIGSGLVLRLGGRCVPECIPATTIQPLLFRTSDSPTGPAEFHVQLEGGLQICDDLRRAGMSHIPQRSDALFGDLFLKRCP